MSSFRRIFIFIKALLMIFMGLFSILSPGIGYYISALIIGAYITIYAISDIIFYFTSARYMVGGGKILINGVIFLDFGILSFFVLMETTAIAMIYFAILFLILGIVDLLRSIEIKKNGSKKWIFKLIESLFVIGLSILCVVFVKSLSLALLFLSISWLFNGAVTLFSAFKKSSIIYIS